MRNLLNFIIRNSHWLVAILLIAFSFYLVFSYNSYQRSVFLSSANRVVGWCYTARSNVTSFFHLKGDNRRLLERAAQLEQELYLLKAELDQLTTTDSSKGEAFVMDAAELMRFEFIPAEVVNLSFAGPNNFITLNKGALHGVKQDMGVISRQGVAGVVATVSDNFSMVIPVINPKFRLSAKLKNSDNYGSISWDGREVQQAQLGELPKHEIFHPGDTVITSFSRIFPKRLIVGYVSGMGESKDDNFNTFNIRLATDFYSLRDVLIIQDAFYEEQKTLEEEGR